MCQGKALILCTLTDIVITALVQMSVQSKEGNAHSSHSQCW